MAIVIFYYFFFLFLVSFLFLVFFPFTILVLRVVYPTLISLLWRLISPPLSLWSNGTCVSSTTWSSITLKSMIFLTQIDWIIVDINKLSSVSYWGCGWGWRIVIMHDHIIRLKEVIARPTKILRSKITFVSATLHHGLTKITVWWLFF